jgi:hypothetical protein
VAALLASEQAASWCYLSVRGGNPDPHRESEEVVIWQDAMERSKLC